MKSGFHQHNCPKGQHTFRCPKITHCNDPEDTPCPDHKPDLVESRAEEDFVITGKRPGE